MSVLGCELTSGEMLWLRLRRQADGYRRQGFWTQTHGGIFCIEGLRMMIHTFIDLLIHRVYELILIMLWTLAIRAKYSPLWPGSVSVTQREFWLCLFDPVLIYDQLSILSHNLLWTCPHRVESEGLWCRRYVLETSEDLIIDDEAENDFLCLVSGAMKVVYAGFSGLLCLVKCRWLCIFVLARFPS